MNLTQVKGQCATFVFIQPDHGRCCSKPLWMTHSSSWNICLVGDALSTSRKRSPGLLQLLLVFHLGFIYKHLCQRGGCKC